MKRLKIKIYGQVQNVGFRFSAKKKAETQGLNGFTRNEENGGLYIEVEGEEKELKYFLDWCRHGPPLAKVEKIDFEFIDQLKNYQGFNLIL